MERGIDVQMVLDHGHQHIDRDGGPDLSLDGVLRGAKESVDPLMLLDPLNQDFPLACVHGKCRGVTLAGSSNLLATSHSPCIQARGCMATARFRMGCRPSVVM